MFTMQETDRECPSCLARIATTALVCPSCDRHVAPISAMADATPPFERRRRDEDDALGRALSLPGALAAPVAGVLAVEDAAATVTTRLAITLPEPAGEREPAAEAEAAADADAGQAGASDGEPLSVAAPAPAAAPEPLSMAGIAPRLGMATSFVVADLPPVSPMTTEEPAPVNASPAPTPAAPPAAAPAAAPAPGVGAPGLALAATPGRPRAVRPMVAAAPVKEERSGSLALKVVGGVVGVAAIAAAAFFAGGRFGAPSQEYPSTVQTNFVLSCTETGASIDMCRCMLAQLQDSFTLGEFLNVDNQMHRSGDSLARILGESSKCMR